jgi:hypothetical protein
MTVNAKPDPRIEAAVAEMQAMIMAHYPAATFDVAAGEDLEGIYVPATVDVDDTDEVFDVVVRRLLELQVEERIPIYVIPVRPFARVAAELREREAAWARSLLPAGRSIGRTGRGLL